MYNIAGVRKEYVEELYDKENKPSEEEIPLEESVEEDMQGPLILFSEFETALAELKTKKAEGPDGIPGELLKSLGSTGKQELFAICNQIYETGAWPNDYGICNYPN